MRKSTFSQLAAFFALIAAPCLLLTSCSKTADSIISPIGVVDSIKMPGCHIASQSTLGFGAFPYGGGFVAEYNVCGQPTSLATAIMVMWGDVDSIYYTFHYEGMNPHVKAYKKHYAFFPNEDPNLPGALVSQASNYPDEEYEFDVILNSNIHAAISAGTTEFLYEDGKLASILVDSKLVSVRDDGKGNILGLSSGGDDLITYTYDYSQEATNQLYASSGYEVSEEYNLMEILSWIPVSPHHLRLEHAVALGKDVDTGELYYAGMLSYTQHVVDSEGKLISFISEDEETVVNAAICF